MVDGEQTMNRALDYNLSTGQVVTGTCTFIGHNTSCEVLPHSQLYIVLKIHSFNSFFINKVVYNSLLACRYSRSAATVRNRFRDYFLNPVGELSWQYRHIRHTAVQTNILDYCPTNIMQTVTNYQ